MGRPGLLEFVVYALVLTTAAGWVYALPPFTHKPGDPVQTAAIEPTSAQDEQTGKLTEIRNEDSDAAAAPAAGPAQAATGSEPDEQPDLGRQANLLVVTARSLNMRSEPNAGSRLVGNYPRGALVEEMDVSGNWVLVRAEDDTTGWMYTAYLGKPEN